MSVYWLSGLTCCDHCNASFEKLDTMYDAATVFGPWGNLCEGCFASIGKGLGIGNGQKYAKQADGKWLCIEGGKGLGQ